MKPIKSTVYLPVKVERHRNHHIFDLNECEGSFIQNVAEESGYFFTPEQLNEYTQSVIKEALETAAEKTEVVNKAKFKGDCNPAVDEESIINIYEEVYKKLKV